MEARSLFLTYNRADQSTVVAVQRLLKARGVATFLDRDQVPGLPWPVALEEALRGASAVAVFLGRELGGWQKREMWFALDRQVREEKERQPFPVIPVLLPGADLTPGFLFSCTWIDLRDGLDAANLPESLDLFERSIDATGPAAPAERATSLCPYRGLEAFREEDAAFFAGRASFARQLFEFTLRKNLVAVVGPSGSGKSSIIQAALIPLLRRQRPPSSTWDAITFTPGSTPFHRLASALIPLIEPDLREIDCLAEAQKLGDRLAAGEVRLEAAIDRAIQKSDGTGRLLLIADQFEEVFTLTPEPDRRPYAQALMRALGKAAFTLLVTLRADFYSQIITLDRELSDRLALAQINIGALTPEELRETIVAPAKLVGLEYESGLVDRILRDVGSEPGNLPLLEFALTALWSNRQGRTLTNAAYNEIGGVTGALAQRAETEFGRFTPEEQTAARRLFSGLVRVATPEEGAEDTRQRLELKETDVSAIKVAQTLSHKNVRLLVMGRPEGSGASEGQMVEVAHEALLRNWERLRLWLNEDREFLLWRQRTHILVAQWEQHGRDDGDLLRGVSLSEAERWLAARPRDLTEMQAHFITESTSLHERERAAEEQRRLAEVETAKRLRETAEARARSEHQSARRLRRFSWVLALLLLAALGVTGFALWERATANARAWVARSILAQNTDPELSVLFAVQGIAATWPIGHIVLPEAEQRLHSSILASHVRLTLSRHSGGVTSVAWSPDGKRLATGSGDKTAKVWDAATGNELLTLGGHTDAVESVAWSPDGKRLATASHDGTAKVWDATTGKALLTLAGHGLPVMCVGWSSDGKRLATGAMDNTVKVWDSATGQELLTLSAESQGARSVAWSPDGNRLATAGLPVKVWDGVTGKELLTLSGYDSIVWSVAWSPDGKRLATGSLDNTAKVWDADTGKELRTLSGHGFGALGGVISVCWRPDGQRLATAGSDETAKVWDAAGGNEQLTLSGHRGIVWSVAWSPDGKRLATAGSDETAKVWDLDTGEERLTVSGKDRLVFRLAWSPDGKKLAAPSTDKMMAKVWDAATGKEVFTLSHSGGARSVAWSLDGKRLAAASESNIVRVWDAWTGKEQLTLPSSSSEKAAVLILAGTFSGVWPVAWSPDGKRLATASEKTAKVWDAATGEERLTLSGHGNVVWSVAWSLDGRRLATGSNDNTAKVWDAATGNELLTLIDHAAGVTSVAWSPGGRQLATSSADRTAKLWDAVTGKKLLTLSGHGDVVNNVAWSPDGKRLATGSRDGTAKVWSTATGEELLTLSGQRGNVQSVTWSPDGKRLAASFGDATVQIYAMDIRDLMALARKRVTDYPSEENCKNILHDKCPAFPKLSIW
jgi:WD40 repeat protein